MFVFACISINAEKIHKKPKCAYLWWGREGNRWGQTSQHTRFYIVFILDHVNAAPILNVKVKNISQSLSFHKRFI